MAIVSVDELRCLTARGEGEMMVMAPNKDGGWSLVKKESHNCYKSISGCP